MYLTPGVALAQKDGCTGQEVPNQVSVEMRALHAGVWEVEHHHVHSVGVRMRGERSRQCCRVDSMVHAHRSQLMELLDASVRSGVLVLFARLFMTVCMNVKGMGECIPSRDEDAITCCCVWEQRVLCNHLRELRSDMTIRPPTKNETAFYVNRAPVKRCAEYTRHKAA